MSADLTIYIGDAGEKYSDPDDWRELMVDGRLRADSVVPHRRGGVLAHARAEDIPELAAVMQSLHGPQVAPAATDSPADGVEPLASPAVEPAADVLELTPSAAENSLHHPPVAGPFGGPAARVRRSKPDSVWPVRMLAGFAGLVILAILIGVASNSADPRSGALAEGSGAVTMFVARETRVRSEPSARGPAPIASLSRGEEVNGVWVEGSGGARWLELTSGPYSGAYVWGANLLAGRPPELETVTRTARAALNGGPMLSGPRPDANVLTQVEPGMSLSVVGRTASGWLEVERPSGGIGYVNEALFEQPVSTEAADAQWSALGAASARPPARTPSPPRRIGTAAFGS